MDLLFSCETLSLSCYDSLVSFIYSLDPTFLCSFLRRLTIAFFLVEKCYIVYMARSDRSDITINTALAGTSGSNNRRKKTNAQKKAKRHYARWLMAYVATYGLQIGENYGFHEYMEVADLILNQEANYLDPQKSLSELNSLVRIAQQEKKNFPYDIEEHPLT